MLNEGWRRRERGTDVVVGYVETHDRPRTAAQLGDLEVDPAADDRTTAAPTFEEMDLDAVLARHPEVALVDELAHTNVPGSRNEKRWQDIEELLDAGIDVISTVNIQHLESLNDVVERITGIRQQETIPDDVVRGAEQVELVDMTPEALRRRMAHGNIYAPDKVDAALGNYFRLGNLAALRELALLWVADRVDESLQEYRERHGIAAPWETRERVVVAVTGAPGGDNLIRRAARMAQPGQGRAGRRARPRRRRAGDAGSGVLLEHRRLVEELGGTYHEVVGADVAKALVQIARAENATQLVLGASRRSRWEELIRGSIIDGIIREAGRALDVHVISTERRRRRRRAHRRCRRSGCASPRCRGAARSPASLLAVSGCRCSRCVLTPFRDRPRLHERRVLLPAARRRCRHRRRHLAGRAVAAVAGVRARSTGSSPTRSTRSRSRNERDLVALVVFLLVAGVVSTLVDVAARRSAEAGRARGRGRGPRRAWPASLLRKGDPLPELLAHLRGAVPARPRAPWCAADADAGGRWPRPARPAGAGRPEDARPRR